MSSKYIDDINKEFEDFQTVESVHPPLGLTEKIQSYVHRDLNPSGWNIFAKLSLIHFLTGIVTLSLCPQFGVRVFGEGLGLMRYFSVFGQYGCMAACGAFYVGTTLLVASFMLKPEEVRVLKRRPLLQLSALALLSLGVFVMVDAEILFGFGIAWLVGSMLGGLAMLEVGWMFKRRMAA